MRMHELVEKATPKGKRAGNWLGIDRGVHGHLTEAYMVTRNIYHYETKMLSFVIGEDGEWDGNMETVDYSIGHGTVSDQNGMNKLFARLSMPLAYYRDRRGGGPRIAKLDSPQYRYGITRRTRERNVGVREVLATWPLH